MTRLLAPSPARCSPGGKGGARAGAARTTAESGFTLVEILVVITIIGLIMGLVGPRVLNYLGESKVKAAQIQIESLASALDLFYLDAGRYPSTPEGLTALVQRPRRRAELERPLSEERPGAERSLGPSLSLSLARRHGSPTTSSRSAPTGRRAARARPPTSAMAGIAMRRSRRGR